MKVKKQITLTILLASSVASLYFVPWTLLIAWLLPLPNTVEKQVEEAVNYDFEGIIVYVEKSGKTPELYAAGWHDRKNKTPAYPEALFKIASVGKLYDAVAVTKLVHNKQLSLDKTLAAYFPELIGRIENADKITLKMMVQHRSGIPNYTNHPTYWTNPPKGYDEALNLVLDLPSNFNPDEDYEYSNTNYLLINKLIEKTVNKSKFNYIEEVIIKPLGLKNTYASIHDVNMDQVMSGYYAGIEEDIKTSDYGSMLATAQDVGVFLRALNDGSLLTPEEQLIYSSLYKYEHTGLIAGYQTIAKYHKEIDTVIIQFTNTTDFNGYHWSLSEIIYERILKIKKTQMKS